MPPIRRAARSASYDREALRRRREDAGLTQADLARAAQLSTSSVSDLELGRHGAAPATLLRIANALGCTLDDLRPAP